MDHNMKRVLDESRDPVNAVEATTAIDNIVDLDPPGVEYRAIEEMMPPLREEMPSLPRAIQEMMPPEYGPPELPTSSKTFEPARNRNLVNAAGAVYPDILAKQIIADARAKVAATIHKIGKNIDSNLFAKAAAKAGKDVDADIVFEVIKDHPDVHQAMQDLGDAYAEVQFHPIPPGLEYVEHVEEVELLPPSPEMLQILEAVGLEFAPPNLDFDLLERSIEECVECYSRALKVRPNKDERTGQVNRLRQICETAQQLASLLKQEGESDWREQLEDQIRRKESELEDLEWEVKLSKPGTELKAAYRRQSALDLLVGVLLPPIFERLFGVKPTYIESGRTAFYVRFVQAVLRRSGITKKGGKPYAAGTIVKALTDANGRIGGKK